MTSDRRSLAFLSVALFLGVAFAAIGTLGCSTLQSSRDAADESDSTATSQTREPSKNRDAYSARRLETPRAADVEIVGHVVEPKRLEPSEERLADLVLPEGFELTLFAEGLVAPRMLAVSTDGTVYATRRALGDVVMLRDRDGDGHADGEPVVVARRPDVHGITIDGTTVYLVTIKDVYRTQIREDGMLEPLERLVDDLPDAGQHPNRMVVVGPDRHLYVSVGSTCNACDEANPENATILRIAPDGSSRTIFASGLRNTIGFGFHPVSGALIGMDHGIDWLGDDAQSEELNEIVEGGAYGWPYVYGDGRPNPQDAPPAGIAMSTWAEQSIAPVALYDPHSAPMQMAMYTGRHFPDAYHGDAFVAMHGSWNRNPPSGYEVLRIRFRSGRPVAIEPFLTGFLVRDGTDWAQIGRPVGLAQAGDGALLLADDANGRIYRIAYVGGAQTPAAVAEPPPSAWVSETATTTGAEGPGDAVMPVTDRVIGSPRMQAAVDTPERLANAILETGAPSLRVEASGFEDGGMIPRIHAAEGENLSPALRWSPGPAGTRSYALFVEDPDVSQEPPFVHWLLYDLPASVTALEEAIPATPRLLQPEGALQGRNDRGSIGYFGPRPPRDDPPHAYHFQVFALDAPLDLAFGASRAELLEAMRDRVLAWGEIVGRFER